MSCLATTARGDKSPGNLIACSGALGHTVAAEHRGTETEVRVRPVRARVHVPTHEPQKIKREKGLVLRKHSKHVVV